MPKAIFFVSVKVPFVADIHPKYINTETPEETSAAPIRAIPVSAFPVNAKIVPAKIPPTEAPTTELNTAHKEMIKDQRTT